MLNTVIPIGSKTMQSLTEGAVVAVKCGGVRTLNREGVQGSPFEIKSRTERERRLYQGPAAPSVQQQ
jgi:hypothetical protein